jgi:GTP:adenosylcobinamide-phosphate guanylyltransferase
MSDAGGKVTALVLAGSRGPTDPVARVAGVAYKALAPVAGVPMLLRVMRTLAASESIGEIALGIDPAALNSTDAETAEELRDMTTQFTPLGKTPSQSVQRALEALPTALPLLVTTADHALLTPAMVDHFCRAAPEDADVAFAVATETLLRRDYPDTRRTYYRLAGQGYSGCNLFLLRRPAAAKVAAFWSEMERYRKRPWRLVAAIGPLTLVSFLLGRLSLDDAARRLSEIVGATVKPVEMPFAEAAIDVDKPADLTLAEVILKRRV